MDHNLLEKAQEGDFDSSIELCRQLLIEEGIDGDNFLYWCRTVAGKCDAEKLKEHLNICSLSATFGCTTVLMTEEWDSFTEKQIEVLVKGTIYKFCENADPNEISRYKETESQYLCWLGVGLIKTGRPQDAANIMIAPYHCGYAGAEMVLGISILFGMADSIDVLIGHEGGTIAYNCLRTVEAGIPDIDPLVEGVLGGMAYIGLECCYLYGIGTEKNIEKARSCVLSAREHKESAAWADQEIVKFRKGLFGGYSYTG